MTTPEPLSEAELAAWRADPERDSHHALGRCWATIEALTTRAEAAEQQAVANDIERAGWQATAEAAENALAEAVELLRRVRDTHHVVRPCHCEVCAFLAARDASEGSSERDAETEWEREQIRFARIDRLHQDHYRSGCNCLGDSDVCCVESCPCHEPEDQS